MVGTYSPVAKPRTVILKHERIAHWMKNGAQPSDTVARLLRDPKPAPRARGLSILEAACSRARSLAILTATVWKRREDGRAVAAPPDLLESVPTGG